MPSRRRPALRALLALIHIDQLGTGWLSQFELITGQRRIQIQSKNRQRETIPLARPLNRDKLRELDTVTFDNVLITSPCHRLRLTVVDDLLVGKKVGPA